MDQERNDRPAEAHARSPDAEPTQAGRSADAGPWAPPYSGPALCGLEAHQAVTLLRSGEITPRDLLDAAYARIDAVGPHINATVHTCRDRAYAAADAIATGSSTHPGWLAGLPIGIKDLSAVAGVRTTWGNVALADTIPTESDPVVERLERRGAVITGKTNTPELGAGGNTFNDVYGATRNPWDTRLNAGGSSGGAAASLATGEVWLSHGSDHGGSLRTPAAFCGVVGLRPSPGVVGNGAKGLSFNREGVQGPMARSVTDCALFLDAMAGYDARIPVAWPEPEIPYQTAVKRADPRLHIAYSRDLDGLCPVEPEVEAALRGALLRMEREGATVAEDCPDLTDLETTYHVLRGLMWAGQARLFPPKVRAAFKATLEENTRFGEALTADRIIAAQIARGALYRRVAEFLARYDVLACPVVGCLPRPQSEEWVHTIAGVPLDGYMDWLRFAFLATATGLPAISVPVGLSASGLPVGLQLIGRPRGEAALLAAARAVEIVCGGPLGPIDPVLRHR